MHRYQAIARIIEALDHAEAKFPGWPIDPVHAGSVLTEESGETVKAINEFFWSGGPPSEIEKEAAQAGAMAVRVLMGWEKYERKDEVDSGKL